MSSLRLGHWLALACLPLAGCQKDESALTASASRNVPDRAVLSDASPGRADPAEEKAGEPGAAQPRKAQGGQPNKSTGAESAEQEKSAGKERPGAGDTSGQRQPPGGQAGRQATRQPPRASPGRPLDITFDDILFEMEKGDPFQRSMLTEGIEAMEGKAVRIRGYIHPNVFTQSGITTFVLVRDNQECCFGPGAMLYDCILVAMKPGKSTDFTTRPIAVEGTFSIQEVVHDGVHLAIYHIDADKAG